VVTPADPPGVAPDDDPTGDPVADLLYLLVLIGFFALMVLFVRVCERIVGPDDAGKAAAAAAVDVDVAADRPVAPEEVTA